MVDFTVPPCAAYVRRSYPLERALWATGHRLKLEAEARRAGVDESCGGP